MKTITVHELQALRNGNEPYLLFDVREEHEFETGEMGGTLLPKSELLERYTEIPKEGKVIIHCRSGKRSADVIAFLEYQYGYSNLYNLEGGIMAWAQEIDPSIEV